MATFPINAIYYPHTQIASEMVLKNALLLWDSVETIVPWRLKSNDRSIFHSHRLPMTRHIRDAQELVVRPHVPNEEERATAHDRLQKLLEQGLLAELISRSPVRWRSSKYLVYPEKFLNETWRMLERHGMSEFDERSSDYGVPPVLGLLMLSILSDICAGTQLMRITDRVEAYTWIARQHAALLESPYITGLDPAHVAPALDRLVTISLDVLDARQIPLERLVELRQRETKSGGAEYSKLRRRYLKLLQDHINRIRTEVKTTRDLTELEKQFKADLEEKLADLKAELRLASLKTLFSKEVAISVLLGAGALLSPISGLAALAAQVGGSVGTIPLVKAAVDYKGSKRKVLQENSLSWLYLSTRDQMTLY